LEKWGVTNLTLSKTITNIYNKIIINIKIFFKKIFYQSIRLKDGDNPKPFTLDKLFDNDDEDIAMVENFILKKS
jgi:hypothetical protein